ncbi:MAG: adenylate cyclase [Parasphingorhabdus sp.]|jgi:adenylate cyclase
MTTSIKSSPELEAVAMRFLKAMCSRDAQQVTSLLSKSEYLRYVGSDSNEFWNGQLFRNGFGDHVSELPSLALTPSHIEAFENGQTGWAMVIAELSVENLQTHTVRFSLVFVMEDGGWKVVQSHLSFPRANLEIIGKEHSALDKLVESARQGFEPNQSEGTLTVMFTDIVDSTTIAHLVGDRVWVATINRHIAALKSSIEAYGGCLVKSLGDGTMSTFPSARKALMAAKEIQKKVKEEQQESAFQIRVGLHTGDVIQSNGDFFGTVVNKAARIASLAIAEQILVSEVTQVMVRGSDDCQFGKPVYAQLKGIDGEHALYSLQ